MPCHLLLAIACLLAKGMHAYAPIQWMKFPAKGLVLTPSGFARSVRGLVPPQELALREPPSTAFPSGIPHFTFRPDETITWDDAGWCIEAGGHISGSAVRVNRCTGEPAQKWHWKVDGHGRTMIQLNGTKNCIGALDSGGELNRVAVELRACECQVSKSWKFGGSLPIATRGVSTSFALSSDVRHLLFFLCALVGVAALGFRLRQSQSNQRVASSADIALRAHKPVARAGGVSMNIIDRVFNRGSGSEPPSPPRQPVTLPQVSAPAWPSSNVPNPHFACQTGAERIKLNDGNSMPCVGLGVYRVSAGKETRQSVTWALEVGYRMVDTAMVYGNEKDVGRGLQDSGIPREEVFIQSKLWFDQHGYDNARRAAIKSLKESGLEYFDSYLIHSPYEGKLVETWDALLSLQREGYVRSVGVSNFDVRHLELLRKAGRPVPAINQFEMHPLIYQERADLVEYCQSNGILAEAYGSIFGGDGDALQDRRLEKICQAHPGKTVHHVLLRWALQRGFQVIPKSVRKKFMQENFNVFDFELSSSEMEVLSSFESQGSVGYWNPVADAPVEDWYPTITS